MNSITPHSIDNPITIRLQPEWFQSGYYVYVVNIALEGKSFFYVGMTGDRKYHVARSPFYRMSGHFETRKSTQNQIIKGLEAHFPGRKPESLLTAMRCEYQLWKLFDYQEGDTDHDKKRQYAEKVESALIHLIRETKGKESVFNHQLSSRSFRDPEPYQQAQEVFRLLF